MKNQTFKLAALAAATFGWISLAAAQGPEGGQMGRPGGPGGPGVGQGFGPGGPGGPRVGMMARRLGLSDEQKAQWQAIHEREREAAKPLMEAARGAREAFDQALKAENADAATVGQAAITMRDARAKIQAHHQAVFEQVKAILTPEQVARIEEMEKRGLRRGRGGPDGHGPRGRRPGRSK
jgi:Spy/CpxP family protein refolding chaperone